MVRKECAPLVSIALWHNLSSDQKREQKLDQTSHLRKAWRAAAKRFDAADDETKAKLRFDRSWLYSLVLDFLSIAYLTEASPEQVRYCEFFIEFLADLQSQQPTRRYVNSLLQDLHVLSALRLSPLYNDEENTLVRDMVALLAHYTNFIIDDHTGVQLSRAEAYDRHCAVLGKLQRTVLTHFKDKLMVLALSNYGSIDKRDDLEGLLEALDDEELARLANLLGLRTSYPESLNIPVDRAFLMEILLSTFERKKTFQDIAQDISLFPTEESLFEKGLLRAEDYDGSRPLAIPKLNLQYLSVGDFLWRGLILARSESFYGIRKDIEETLERVKPQSRKSGDTIFTGFSRMALPVSKPVVIEVLPPLIGDHKPSTVKAELSIDVRHLNESVRRDWESLRPDDVVFLLAVDGALLRSQKSNGERTLTEAQKRGILAIRAAEVVHISQPEPVAAGEESRGGERGRGRGGRGRGGGGRGGGERRIQRPPPTRRLVLKLDAASYQRDMDRVAAGKPDIYERINLLIRRRGKENNFRPVLESIQTLTLSNVPLADWIHEVFLGYGDPANATYKHLPNRLKKIDFRDTFLDWQHLVESLPGKIIEPSEDASGSFGPPYVLEMVEKGPEEAASKQSKKRRRDAEPALVSEIETLKVSTYKPPNTGPYPVDAPRPNTIRFTPAQVEAIMSGTQPGLTVIVGPPGTGKTDVAVQIINNIYHDFPDQRTLLIAHSNQALNQLFAKIVALDIDERHLLRLGHGEEELDTEASFGKAGRVESFMANRDRFLQEVTRLAASIGAPGAHGNSAEVAGYFYSVYIEPAWARFTAVRDNPESTRDDIVRAFPFHAYFSTAPQPLFPSDADREAVVDITEGCYTHISKIFSELADILPFELLRRDREKSNYLLTNEARIIAMTATHAAMRRGDIASLGFHYDNVVMEEAAQITEVESFIPMALQKPLGGKMPLQRVILCGDHLQNSPVIQNMAFRQYSNLEQSLFSRLVRLGVPTITLDQQGRARPSIAKLYRWRYPHLGNLPHVQTEPDFLLANPGFKYEYQFIDVPDFNGRGEVETAPHVIQNLGEAEYAVAIYQYMRLLGYPAHTITILSTYSGQRALIRDVLAYRCARNPIFGMPRAVATVDKYQGEQNDCT